MKPGCEAEPDAFVGLNRQRLSGNQIKPEALTLKKGDAVLSARTWRIRRRWMRLCAARTSDALDGPVHADQVRTLAAGILP
ncbi:hypothetical protein GCM10022224_016890 [Nonomuraea antimicrobica]|uniref:Uncharacterized protein n=1 Tax=Nonomuraea antimicrobica TaxID=561173 RepID=A0ABP7BDA2_9ACTN